MICPFCREKDTSVVDSRPTEDGTAIRRRRVCTCGGGQRFTTFERVQFRELTVIKKNGRRTPFDREKLAKSLFTALKKRPIDSDTTEKIISKISRELEEIGQSEIQSSVIGKKVMDELKELDKIAYIRFASVYTNFKEIGEFGEYIDELHGKPKKNKHQQNLTLAFELAKINIGSTKENPSVGCVVEKNGSIISSGYTSFNGRPHAEFNALNKKLNFVNSNIYITLEPCSHFGKTPPCTNIIKRKRIKRVYYSIDDFDKRSQNKSKQILSNQNIITNKFLLKKKGLRFYQSYFRLKKNKLPLLDAKIAISKDYYTKNKKNKWITNERSRKLAHLLRSRYNALISTSRSINEDNSVLTCRIKGLTHKSPHVIIIDRNLILKKDLSIFKTKNRRKIYIITTKDDKKKIKWLKKHNIKVIKLQKLDSKEDFGRLFQYFTKLKYSRIFVESGLTFMNFLMKNNFLNNIYIFKTNLNLNKNGINNSSNKLMKRIKLKNKLKVYLENDNVYFESLK